MSTKSPPVYKTDYAAHDREYQRLRAKGQKGWSADVEDNNSKRAWIRTVLASRPACSEVLFLGCGAGEFVIDAARAGAKACGIDIAPTAVAMAQAEAAAAGIACKFVIGSVLALPFADQSIDIAVDDHCLHCIIGGDRPQFLAEAKRVLKPRGILLIRSMCSVPEGAEIDLVTRCTVVNGVATRYYGTVGRLLAEIGEAGFDIRTHRIQASGPEGSDLLEIEAIRP